MNGSGKVLAAVVFVICAAAGGARAQAIRPAGATFRPKLHVSHETTRILGPLRADGYVDYARALDEKLRRGVTAENNAVALLWQVFGPKYYSDPPPEAYFHALGISRPPEKGRYFSAPGDFLKNFRTEGAPRGLEGDEDEIGIHDQIEQSSEQPWSRKEFPLVDAWLGANRKPLELAAAAVRRSRLYEPRVAMNPDAALSESFLIGSLSNMSLRRAWHSRAMSRMHDGDLTAAWEDLMSCYRLGQLTAQGPYLVDHMVGQVIGQATSAHEQVVTDNRLTAAQIAQMRRDLAQLQPMRRLIDVMDTGERYFGLDSITQRHRRGPPKDDFDFDLDSSDDDALSWVEWLVRQKPPEKFQGPARELANRAIDCEMTLRVANHWYDRIIAAGGIADAKRRMTELKNVESAIDRISAHGGNPIALIAILTLPDRQRRQALALVLANREMANALWTFVAIFKSEQECATQWQLVDVALAIAAYRVDHKKLPAKLDDLVPKYLKVVPRDPYRDSPLTYKSDGRRYLLYSVGADGKDDGGKSHAEALEEPGDSGDESVVGSENPRYDIVIGTPK
jgi:hypothetical protein